MSGTILLADDSLTIQKVVELTFADTDYRVVAVSSGDELLERMRDSQPDVIICDVIMPGKDGYEVCQEIKSSSDWLHLPVILLTGTFEPFDRDRAIAAGCSEIITKPFEARKLVDTVERLIGGGEIHTPQEEAVSPPAATDEPAPPEAPEEFGTQLSAPEPEDDGIEFTTTGFDEMEAAGEQPATAVTPPDGEDALEYEFGEAAAEEPAVEPEPDLSAQTVRIDTSDLDLDTDGGVAEPGEVAAVESEAASADDVAAEPPAAAEEEPFPAEGEIEETPAFEDESSMADTSPIDPPSEVEEAIASETPIDGSGLSDADIDRIARRVLELASDRLEQIAWEVVPDMAEIVVRQRIRELESETEAAAPDSVQ